MSDMKTERLTVRLDVALRDRVRRRAKALGVSESDYARRAIEEHAVESRDSDTAYDRFKRAGLIGISDIGPSDLSTNKKHMEGFGKPRR